MGSVRHLMVTFVRSHPGLSLTEVLTWHPRDFDTWLTLDEQESEDGRFGQLHRDHSEKMGR